MAQIRRRAAAQQQEGLLGGAVDPNRGPDASTDWNAPDGPS